MAPAATTSSQRSYAKRARQLSTLVRRLRQQANATLSELAARTGLSAATLSKIENDRLSPGYDTLMKLADGLGVELAALFDAAAPHADSTGRRSITHQGAGRVHETPHYRYEMYGADLIRRQFTPLVTTVTARTVQEFGDLPRHRGEEFVYVLSGEIELHTEQYEPTRLGPGDGCYFDSSMGHACISVSEQDAVVLWIASNADSLRASNVSGR
jgi:transcriptional regulator with XRE-family HTH domain